MLDSNPNQDIFVEDVLNNPDLYVSPQRVLDLAMGKGEEMTPLQQELFAQNKKKRMTFRIACGGYFHKGIYMLSSAICTKLYEHPTMFE